MLHLFGTFDTLLNIYSSRMVCVGFAVCVCVFLVIKENGSSGGIRTTVEL